MKHQCWNLAGPHAEIREAKHADRRRAIRYIFLRPDAVGDVARTAELTKNYKKKKKKMVTNETKEANPAPATGSDFFFFRADISKVNRTA